MKENENIYAPKYFGRNLTYNLLYGRCKCNNGVKEYDKYCSQCGVKLDWNATRKYLRELEFTLIQED